MADDEQKILSDARRLTLPERVQHKNWKARSEAWDDIRGQCDRAFSSSDPILNDAGIIIVNCSFTEYVYLSVVLGVENVW